MIRYTEKCRTQRCRWNKKNDRAVACSLLTALENKRYSKTFADKARKHPLLLHAPTVSLCLS